jgi:2-keto-4-pentenoate hydratase/2-oxohepta-3-ene-1,7-dioic acid hydratase in catechol pathway
VLAVFCKVDPHRWYRVIDHDEHGIRAVSQAYPFNEVWESGGVVSPSDANEILTLPWSELSVAIPDPCVTTFGYALTYASHQSEVELSDVFCFPKAGPAVAMREDILYQPNLDYEAEIGVLMHRDHRDRFGYVMMNDLTDRGIQVRTFDEDNMAPGFAEAKGFPGALRVGPLLAVGNAATWRELQVALELNGVQRQDVRARECSVTPPTIHAELFAQNSQDTWLLTGTGTSEGVLFHTPDFLEKLSAFIKGGLSKRRAENEWLASLTFLEPGDVLVFRSPQLGTAVSRVVAAEPQ